MKSEHIRVSINPSVRFRVFDRDKFTCRYCGEHAPNVKLTCDHVIAVACGGKSEYDNLVTACTECNQGKGKIVLGALQAAAGNPQEIVAPENRPPLPLVEDDRAHAAQLRSVADRPRLRRTEAAVYITAVHGIPVSPKTLAKLACIGGGPKFQKAGRIPLYCKPALDDWALAKLSPELENTSMIRANS